MSTKKYVMGRSKSQTYLNQCDRRTKLKILHALNLIYARTSSRDLVNFQLKIVLATLKGTSLFSLPHNARTLLSGFPNVTGLGKANTAL